MGSGERPGKAEDEMEGDCKCSRCGGTGKVTRGMVINGVCYGCHGTGKSASRGKANARWVKVSQYVIVDAQGRHLALNTDENVLRDIFHTLPDAVAIQPY